MRLGIGGEGTEALPRPPQCPKGEGEGARTKYLIYPFRPNTEWSCESRLVV